jgi:hypothetical protein
MTISAPRYAGASTLRTGRAGRILAILTNEIRTRAGWGTWVIVALSFLAVVLIVVLTAEFASLLGGLTLATLHAPYASPIWPYLTLIIATAVGSGCIADDLGSRAITLYLSRPIHLVDYVVAKTAAVGFWIGLAAIGPGVLGVSISAGLGLISAELAFSAVGAFVGVGLLTTFFFTALGVALSTLTTRALYAGVGIFGVTLSLNIAAVAIFGATQNSSVGYVSPVGDILAAAEAAFQTGTPTDIVPSTAVALLVATTLVLFVVTWVRLNRIEVVGE